MADRLLHHLAVVIDLDSNGEGGALSAAAVGPTLAGRFTILAANAFRLEPGLHCLSLFSPVMQSWFAEPPPPRTGALIRREIEKLAETAGKEDAGFFLVGFPGDLPASWATLFPPSGTSGPSPRRINLFTNYGGRDEIARAAQRCLEDHPEGNVGEEVFSSYLTTAGIPDPDLIIYAGGDLEQKDFLLWQASYAEIWHFASNGLAFGPEDLRRALSSFASRQRRFGKV